MSYSIGQVAEKTGLSAYTLRYYEKEGLLPYVQKNASGLRIYNEDDISWLSMIECLKATGMPIKEIRQYIEWYKEGDATLSKRLELFRKRRLTVEQELSKLKKILGKVEFKIRLYEKAVAAGSLEAANNSEEINQLREELFGDPNYFPEVEEKKAV
ncbi:MAG: MerR family transcriptional regulator [Fibrobacter sp.]|nr:MerR family transcriptional regulator [Fibrobacter sp.]